MAEGTDSSYGTKSITTSASLIAAGRARRDAILVQNVHATQDLYLGPDSSVATSTGIKVAAGQSILVPTRADVYGIASGAATDTRYWEVF
jgi:hypothetical protein